MIVEPKGNCENSQAKGSSLNDTLEKDVESTEEVTG